MTYKGWLLCAKDFGPLIMIRAAPPIPAADSLIEAPAILPISAFPIFEVLTVFISLFDNCLTS